MRVVGVVAVHLAAISAVTIPVGTASVPQPNSIMADEIKRPRSVYIRVSMTSRRVGPSNILTGNNHDLPLPFTFNFLRYTPHELCQPYYCQGSRCFPHDAPDLCAMHRLGAYQPRIALLSRMPGRIGAAITGIHPAWTK